MSTTSRTPSLKAAATELHDQLVDQLGFETIDVFDREAKALAASELGSGAAQPGQLAPGFRLPDARGGEVALEDLLGAGPVVVVFYRGAWCPYCNLQLAAYQGALDEIRAAGGTLVAISPQTPDASLSLAEQKELAFPVLSDTGNAVARTYGLVWTQGDEGTAKQNELGFDLADYNGDDSHEIPAASTFVIARDGTVRFSSVSADYRWRVGPEEVIDVLRAL